MAHDANLPRAVLALAVGTMTGASLVTLVAVLTDPITFVSTVIGRTPRFLVFIYAGFVWAPGFAFLPPVPWAILHHYKKQSWPIAVSFGTVLTFVVTLGSWQRASTFS